MSATHRPSSPAEASGERVFFVMAAAFLVILVAIIGAAFLPVAVGIAVVFGVMAVVLTVFGLFLARLLGGE
jgi:hypothetical protein